MSELWKQKNVPGSSRIYFISLLRGMRVGNIEKFDTYIYVSDLPIHYYSSFISMYPRLVFHSFILPIAHSSYIDSWKKQAWNLRWPFVKFLVLCRLLYCNLSHTLWTLYHIYLVALNFSIILWEFCPWYVLDFPQYWSPLEVHLKAI